MRAAGAGWERTTRGTRALVCQGSQLRSWQRWRCPLLKCDPRMSLKKQDDPAWSQVQRMQLAALHHSAGASRRPVHPRRAGCWVCLDCGQSAPYQNFGHDPKIGLCLDGCHFFGMPMNLANSSSFFLPMSAKSWATKTSTKILATQ